MKCIIPEISWNNRDPVFSLDIQPKVDEFTRLATAGSDTHIVIWYLTIDTNGSVNIDVAADLNKHQKAVNVVRWSPSGELLAAGDDESNIILWKQRQVDQINQTTSFDRDFDTHNDTSTTTSNIKNNDEEYKENWYIYKILRGHMDDVYDISWSPDSKQLVSGSVDNTAIVWNITNKTKHILQPNHKGFVQGVAWDPLNQYCGTLSSDRMLRVFDVHTKRMVSKSSKGTLPVTDATSPLHGLTCRLYHDDTLKSYFRRLTFSPDGKLLIAPTGCVQSEQQCPNKIHFTYIYTRYSFRQPTLALPSPDQFTVAVRCCPMLFELRPDGPTPATIPLPYRMVIAVASQTTITFYDTQQCEPFATITNIHYTRITDVTWSTNGRIVAVSSTDGFCSLILFKSDELGIEYKQQQQTLSTTTTTTTTTTNSCCNDQQQHNDNVKQQHNDSINTNDNDQSIVQMMVDITDDDDDDDGVQTTTTTTTLCEVVEDAEASQDIKLYLESEDTTQDTINNINITTSSSSLSKDNDDNVTNNDNVNELKIIQNENTTTTTTVVTTTNDVVAPSTAAPAPEQHTPKPPRRVTFITLSSPKSKKKLL